MDWSKILVGKSGIPKEVIIKSYKKAILPFSIALLLLIIGLMLYFSGILSKILFHIS